MRILTKKDAYLFGVLYDFARQIRDKNIAKNDYHQAMIKSVIDSQMLKSALSLALTKDIYSREMFMKGIDYSYFYQEN